MAFFMAIVVLILLTYALITWLGIGFALTGQWHLVRIGFWIGIVPGLAAAYCVIFCCLELGFGVFAAAVRNPGTSVCLGTPLVLLLVEYLTYSRLPTSPPRHSHGFDIVADAGPDPAMITSDSASGAPR